MNSNTKRARKGLFCCCAIPTTQNRGENLTISAFDCFLNDSTCASIKTMNRSQSLRDLRPEIHTDAIRSPLPLEQFQNEVLRPILKFQNDIFVAYIRAYLGDVVWPTRTAALEEFIKTRLQKDLALRNTCLGITVGLLTNEELSFYFQHKTELNKRIIQMLCQRLVDQLTPTPPCRE